MLKSFYVLFLTVALLAAPVAHAKENVLTQAQWREDLDQLATTIRQKHPAPFHNVSEKDFNAALAALDADLGDLTDKEIIVRLAEIVALIGDGHTRLALPRTHPEISLEFGHTATADPKFDALKFQQSPLRFEVFEDGIFVVEADERHKQYIGAELLLMGDLPAQDALKAAQKIAFADNSQLAKLMGADRLALPEAMAALGVVKDPSNATVQLRTRGGQVETLSLRPLGKGKLRWRTAFDDENAPLHARDLDRPFWSTYLKDDNIVFAKINEIGDDDKERLAQFVMSTVKKAEQKDAKLVIDLRHNFGGRNDLNKTLVLALIQSDELNQYGRTYVLIGRRTFSAAQLLANDLEKYTRVLFVGEPTGARPDHYGDAKKTALKNSGLTLRVSSLHWSSPIADDQREATAPDLPAPWASSDYFSGGDPALRAVNDYVPKTTPQMVADALRRGDHYQVYRYLSLARLSPDSYGEDFSDGMLAAGRELEAEGKPQLANFMYQYGAYVFPDKKAFADAIKQLEAKNKPNK